jgi:hypothetical protein
MAKGTMNGKPYIIDNVSEATLKNAGVPVVYHIPREALPEPNVTCSSRQKKTGQSDE